MGDFKSSSISDVQTFSKCINFKTPGSISRSYIFYQVSFEMIGRQLICLPAHTGGSRGGGGGVTHFLHCAHVSFPMSPRYP